MMRSDSISVLHITLLSMTAIGLKNHVVIIPPLIQTAGRDAWMSVILLFCISLLWVPLLLCIHNGTKQEQMFGWLKKHIGKIPALLLMLVMGVYFIILIASTLKETITWTKSSYLPETPAFFLTILLGLLCFYLAIAGLRAIAIVNFFVLSAVVVFGFFVGISNFQFKDFSLLKPFLENGYKPVISGMIYPASGMVELIMLLFLQHRLNAPVRFNHFVVNLLLLSWLTIGPLIGAIVEFGPVEAARQRNPAFEEWSLVRVTRYIEHVDFLSIYQWLTGAFIRCSLFLYILKELFQLKNNRQKTLFMLVTLVIVMALTLVGLSDFELYKLMKDVLLPFTVYIFFTVSVLLGLIVLLSRKKTRRMVS
ncbi:endospore germination permease [Brevibacillus sp. AG]|uniref:GerAB/ArcD/ProY family transporter n=1 Tax=Brevibacillus sp. AG TaxID=3020891 RepID=UPI00232AD3F5|nr:endospore germination permease [Brevibacillus sp. AG]MDC0765078.1 endospore germination permease [Brevibacillus sp. AG]